MLLKSGILKKYQPIKSGTSVDDVIEFVRMKMYKDMNDIDGNDSVEGKEDANEVDEGKDDSSDDNDNDDTNSGDDETVLSKNSPIKNASKPSYNNEIPNV